MLASDDLGLHGPGDQLGQGGHHDDQWDTAVREEHVGTALQYNEYNYCRLCSTEALSLIYQIITKKSTLIALV